MIQKTLSTVGDPFEEEWRVSLTGHRRLDILMALSAEETIMSRRIHSKGHATPLSVIALIAALVSAGLCIANLAICDNSGVDKEEWRPFGELEF